MGKISPKKAVIKDKLGPGYYNDGFYSKHTSKSFTMSKAIRPNVLSQRAIETKGVPGIGAYKDIDIGYRNHLYQKNRTAVFLPYKFQRFADVAAKAKAWVPGPGAYNIGPPEISK